VSADGRRWFLLNVSPDVVQQIERTELLGPPSSKLDADVPDAGPPRRMPVMGAVLTNGDLDQYIGLSSLSESTPLSLYSTPETYAGLVVQDTMFRSPDAPRRHELSFHQLELDAFTPLLDAAGTPSGLSVCAFPVPAKTCTSWDPWQSADPQIQVGLIVLEQRSGVRLAYVPGAGSIDGIAPRSGGLTCIFFDGTFWSDGEASEPGSVGTNDAYTSHLPVGGAGGSLELLAELPVRRRFYTHVNDTNPMLRAGSPERRAVEARGWSVAEDGLELTF
jgi:pyrroloquinoline quinone biosynthesis protein B